MLQLALKRGRAVGAGGLVQGHIAVALSVGLLVVAYTGSASALLISPRLEYRLDATTNGPRPTPNTPPPQDRELLESSAFGFGTTNLTATAALGGSTADGTLNATISPTQILIDSTVSFFAANGGVASGSSRNDVEFRLDQPATVSIVGDLATTPGRFPFASVFFGRRLPNNTLLSVFIEDGDSSRVAQTLNLEPGRYVLGVNANHNTERSGNTYVVNAGTSSFDFNVLFAPAADQPGDYNNSGQVEQGDLDLVLQNWGVDTTGNVPSGWTNDLPEGIIDQAELDGVLSNWGSTSAPDFRGANVPEPGALAVLLGAAALATGRRGMKG